MTRLWSLVMGCFMLLGLLVRTGFRTRGPYWRWRIDTAFGRGMPESRRERIHTTLDYGAWMWRMRRL
ncbi:MAG: hypothetical protein H6815_10665 [Phycisphaeraceae bacterium]|nr:hypothetical protein [Phycisphaerales bacterium]MCB9860899.1 hypothetical protein [Phycisphaeraceae bacterium]